jgi:UDP-N-acetylmuramyl tripeptide synthase
MLRVPTVRTRVAVAGARVVSTLSQRVGFGSGTVVGGHVGLVFDPRLLEHLAAGRRMALVSGTNGKTTTTHLLAAAVEGALGPVATNATGSNMPSGHVTALASAPPGAAAVLEVDEGYLAGLLGALSPEAVVLLNLSRDQLDRTNEVRMVANRWRAALAATSDPASTSGAATWSRAARSGAATTTTIANADDPLVTWAASAAAKTIWVGAGLSWRQDAVACPACAGRVRFANAEADGGAGLDGWACACGFVRPRLDVRLEGDDIVLADGRRLELVLALPGRFNRANAVMAAVAATEMGVGWDDALCRIAAVQEVAGRFSVVEVGGCTTRMMLAKNPAGWRELLDLVGPSGRAVAIGINARVADGRDPSWLWDVPFERLRGRTVVATGERCRDLSVRLRYADVPHRTVRDEVAAVRAAWIAGGRASPATIPAEPAATAAIPVEPGEVQVDFVGNYTAFTDLMARSARSARARRRAGA